MNMSAAAYDNSTRFTGLAGIYDRFRPGYPDACLQWMADRAGLTGSAVVADMGAGTGKLSEELVLNGLRTVAVEPNPDMFELLERKSAMTSLLTTVRSRAEDTGLEDSSISLVTAGQSFHWFDPEAFREECARILAPGGRVALLWNSRRRETALVQANAEVFRRHVPAFPGFSGDHRISAEVFAEFFRPGGYEYREFEHDQMLTLDEFLGRNLSATYAPREGDPAHDRLVTDLRALFEEYRESDLIRFPLVTRVFMGGVTG